MEVVHRRGARVPSASGFFKVITVEGELDEDFFVTALCFVGASASNADGKGLERQILPVDSTFRIPTQEEKEMIYDWIAAWELFPFLNEPYAMYVKAERIHNTGGAMPRERYSLYSFVLAETRETRKLRSIFSMEDPVLTELRTQEPIPKNGKRSFFGPRPSASIDFLRDKDETICKDGEEEVSQLTAGKMDPMRYCQALGLFQPDQIGFTNVTGTENVGRLVLFSEAAKQATLIGILDYNGFVVAHWEHVYQPAYRLNTYIIFKDGLPYYFENGTTNGPVGAKKKLRSQGYSAMEWSQLKQGVSVPSRIRVVRDSSTPGTEYELNASIDWKIGKDVNPKFFDPETVGKLSVEDF